MYASEVGQTPAVPPTNWWQTHKTLLVKIGIGLLIAAVVGLTVLFLVRRIAANKAARLAEVAQEQTAVSSAQKDCDQTKNPDKCNQRIAADLAQSTGKVSFCHELSGDAFDNCITLAALTAKSLTACNQVNNAEKKTACTNAVNALLHPYVLQVSADVQAAIDARNPDMCATVEDVDLCLELVGVADRDLDGLSEEKEQTLGTSDTSIDSDADGLSDADEVNIWKTDPAKTDTDGDSYPDGTEVKGGYNPLGSG